MLSKCMASRSALKSKFLLRATPAFSVRVASTSAGGSKSQAPLIPQTNPWHEFTPNGLAVLNTVGNVFALGAAACHDHLEVRLLAGCAATGVAAFNFLMPKPLKRHQWTAGGWGTLFAVLHFANVARLAYESSHGVRLTDEEEDIYEHGFQKFGVTPRQFAQLMAASSTFVDFAPGERIAQQGRPVDRVMFVVHGSAVSRHLPSEASLWECHQDIFIGEVEPKIWRAEYMGTVDIPKPRGEVDTEEEAWLVEHADSLAKRVRGRSARDIRTLLKDGLSDKIGRRTQLVVGGAWKNQITAGPDGCRVISWPLGVFTIVVGADQKLCDSMERIDEMCLASTMVAGAGRSAIEGYKDILDATICDGLVDPQERHALWRYRTRHAISVAEHDRMLREIGWSQEEFEHGRKRNIWDSMMSTLFFWSTRQNVLGK